MRGSGLPTKGRIYLSLGECHEGLPDWFLWTSPTSRLSKLGLCSTDFRRMRDVLTGYLQRWHLPWEDWTSSRDLILNSPGSANFLSVSELPFLQYMTCLWYFLFPIADTELLGVSHSSAWSVLSPSNFPIHPFIWRTYPTWSSTDVPSQPLIQLNTGL